MLRTAGRDGTKLFSSLPAALISWSRDKLISTVLTHSWVNYQFMLNECAIGPLVKG